ncbi:MAG: hypothetical protein H6600_08230 [Flavobacteriales bacterium]|nr:hypothetical protein [Flavobacteriales bacterium]MCB9196401.1 hypothetical protein [Flavobacteriales bacterium]MCB9198431.1 hypothetical protein [Flavobacteriales bacterium]
MKYKQFVILRNSIIALLILTPIVILVIAYSGGNDEDDQVKKLEEPEEISSIETTSSTVDENADPYQIFTYHHQIVFENQKTNISEGKTDENNGGVKKWIEFNKNGTNSFFIDLRCDQQKGYNYFNRVKVDWDKDKNWDEKWTFREDGTVERTISTIDDNTTYDLTYELITDSKLEIGEIVWINTEISGSADFNNLSSSDQKNGKALYETDLTGDLTLAHQEIIELQKNTPISAGKPDDNNGGVKKWIEKSTYFIDLRCDKQKGFEYFNRVKLDWDKDKKWDEKWTFHEDGSIKRVISTSDDNETYNIEYELFSDGTSWIEK